MMNKRAIGTKGEDIATRELLNQGFSIISRNYRNRYGEIDIIAEKSGIIYFAEVKAKKNAEFSRPAESVGPAKRKQVMRMAEMYLAEHGGETDCSFLIIEVYIQEHRTEIIEDSFAD